MKGKRADKEGDLLKSKKLSTYRKREDCPGNGKRIDGLEFTVRRGEGKMGIDNWFWGSILEGNDPTWNQVLHIYMEKLGPFIDVDPTAKGSLIRN